MRKPLEAIGAQITYDASNGIAVASKDGTTIKVPIGESAIYVNGQKAEIDTEAIIKGGRTYIPLRAVFSAFGYDVEWHGNSKTIYLSPVSPAQSPTSGS